MSVFEIIVQRASGGKSWVTAEYTPPQTLLPRQFQGEITLKTDRLVECADDVRKYGDYLQQCLFKKSSPKPLEDFFREAVAQFQRETLPILLTIEDVRLVSLHWERLCAPINGASVLLAHQQQTPLALHIPTQSLKHFPPISSQNALRSLVVCASPQSERASLPPFDIPTVLKKVRDALPDVPCDVLANIEADSLPLGMNWCGLPTLDILAARLMNAESRYTFLHLVCHGTHPSKEEPFLFLANASGEDVTAVAASGLLDRLESVQYLPYLIFLASCETARGFAEDPWGGLAQRLVRKLGIPAVVAMTDRVSVQTADAIAQEFYVRLMTHGYPDRALTEARAALASKYDGLVPALFSRLHGTPIFHDDLDAPLTVGEIRRGLEQMKPVLHDRAPFLFEALQKTPIYTRQERDDPPWATQFRVRLNRLWQAFESALKSCTNPQQLAAEVEGWTALYPLLDAVCQNVLEKSFTEWARGHHSLPPMPEKETFQGLLSFGYEKRDFFFGREDVARQMANLLRQEGFLAIVGPSGCGKSSLAQAGVVPELFPREEPLSDNAEEQNRQVAEQTERIWEHLVVMRPGSEPIAALEAAEAVFAEKVQNVSPEGRTAYVLLVDQFEEIFTQCTEPAKRQEFVHGLEEIMPRLRLMLTLREDFAKDCREQFAKSEFPKFWEKMEHCQKRLETLSAASPSVAGDGRLMPMTAEELRRAIRQQTDRGRLRFEQQANTAEGQEEQDSKQEMGLLDEMIDDVRNEPGAMPLLQMALKTLADRRHGRWLRADEYRESMGGVRLSIALAADSVLSKDSKGNPRTEAEQQRILDIFARLTRLGDE